MVKKKMSKPIEISFAPKKKETYIVNSGTKYGHFSKQELKSQVGDLEKDNEPLYTAPLLLKLFMLTSSLNINPFYHHSNIYNHDLHLF